MQKHFMLLIGLLLGSNFAYAEFDGAYLDAPYGQIVLPKNDAVDNKDLAGFSDTNSLIDMMTPVRAQMSRGTCSIFSATAMIESLLAIADLENLEIDLSEEFMQFIVNAGSTSEGSNAIKNFNAVKSFGMATETTLPYLGDNWLTYDNSLATRRCGHLEGYLRESCLIVHHDPNNLTRSDAEILDITKPWYDPEFVDARSEATEFRNSYLGQMQYGRIYTTSEVKQLLELGIPVILEQRFYYGAWNHRLADELNIGRNYDHWYKGIVGYPFIGSVDRAQSPTKSAGHSILLVGYDDNVEISFNVKMEDGTTQTFTQKGVYYFKNSWGTSGFGAQAMINGVHQPGYGTMVQAYAHEFGSFYKLSIEQ